MLRVAFAVVMTAHALIHTFGFVKAFGIAAMEPLRIPISRPMGVVWLVATVLTILSVVALFATPRWFWAVAIAAIVTSQVAIVASWGDARYGTIANVLLGLAALYGAFAWGPFGLRAEYERLVDDGIAAARPVGSSAEAGTSGAVITEADLALLPAPVQTYLRFVGVVGTRRPLGFRARMTGRIRGSATADWMPFVAEQVNFYDPPRRYFWMEATRGGLPVHGLHAYGEHDASMTIRLLAMVPVVDLHGAAMRKTETVTILNDISIFAPARLLDPAIRWREIDDRSVEATFTNGHDTIRAVLVFGDDGALVDFWSDDRPALAEDGKTLLPQRWSTPLRAYAPMGPYHLATRGEGRYKSAEVDYAYLELEIQEIVTEPVEALAPSGR